MSWIEQSRILVPAMLPFAAAVVLHILMWRTWRRASMVTVLGAPLAAGALLCALWIWLKPGGEPAPDRISDIVAALMTYAGLAYVYVELYSENRTSVRLQALRFIQQQGGTARQEDLNRACGHESNVDQRLAQYRRSGDLVLVDGKYRMARRRILYIALVFRFLRRLMLGTRSGSM